MSDFAGAGLKSMFQLAAIFLEMAYGSKKEANTVLTLNLFTMGRAYERYYTPKNRLVEEG